MRDDVLVIGATGTVGGEVAKAVSKTGARVGALVRSEASGARLPAGVTAAFGDLRDVASLGRAIAGKRSVFIAAPHEPDEETLAARVVAACESAGARLVFVGVHLDGRTRLTRWAQRTIYGRMMPHYVPKFRLAERVRRSSCDPVILVPPNFFQNDELFRDELEAGEFTQAFQRPVNRVDVRDIGLAAARALTDFSVVAGAYPVVGPASLTGADCARVWSDALRMPVRVTTDPARTEAAIARALKGKKREDFLASYRVLARFEMKTLARDLERTEALLGRAPIAYASYVAEVAARWRGARSAAV